MIEEIYGIHAVSALLSHDPARVKKVFLVDGRRDQRHQQLLQLAKMNHIPVERLSRLELDERLPEQRHQGVLAICIPGERPTDILSFVDELTTVPRLLILDGVQDPHNLGACLRTADAAGFSAVVCPKDRSVGLTPAARKVASGAAETVPVFQVTNLARTLEQLKEREIWCFGAAVEATQQIYDLDLKGPIALILGAEGHGLRQLTRERCDHLFHIPMQGCIESLNVSVAAGICMYEVLRQNL